MSRKFTLRARRRVRAAIAVAAAASLTLTMCTDAGNNAGETSQTETATVAEATESDAASDVKTVTIEDNKGTRKFRSSRICRRLGQPKRAGK